MNLSERDKHHAIAWSLAKCLLWQAGGRARIPMNQDLLGYGITVSFVDGEMVLELINKADSAQLPYESNVRIINAEITGQADPNDAAGPPR